MQCNGPILHTVALHCVVNHKEHQTYINWGRLSKVTYSRRALQAPPQPLGSNLIQFCFTPLLLLFHMEDEPAAFTNPRHAHQWSLSGAALQNHAQSWSLLSLQFLSLVPVLISSVDLHFPVYSWIPPASLPGNPFPYTSLIWASVLSTDPVMPILLSASLQGQYAVHR